MSYTYRRANYSGLGPLDTRKINSLLSKSAEDLKEVHGLLREVWGSEKQGTGKAVALDHVSTAHVLVKNLLAELSSLKN